jgi:hypothetical protein
MNDSKKRLLIIVLFGVVAIVAALILTDPSAPTPAIEPVSPSASQASVGPSNTKPTMPQGTGGVNQATRDIFAPPAEYSLLSMIAADKQQNATGQGGSGPKFAAGPLPKLTGVIAGEGSRIAILREGTVSRSYRVGESAGSYRIAAIGANSVTLEGAGGTKVLTMGQ